MKNKGLEFTGKMPDGNKIKFCNDGNHWRGFNSDGVQVGEPYIKLDKLISSLEATMDGGLKVTSETAAPAAELVVDKPREAVGYAGAEYLIKHDGHHYRAYDAKGEQVLAPLMSLQSLLTALKAKIVEPAPAAPEAGSAVPSVAADVTLCGQHRDGICNMDAQKCDGLCGEHAARAPKETEAPQAETEQPAAETKQPAVETDAEGGQGREKRKGRK